MKRKHILSLLLASMLAAGTLLSCGEEAKTPAKDTEPTDNTAAVTEGTTGEPDPFSDFDFGGEQVRFWIDATDNYGTGSSSYLIIDNPENAGDIVNDAVIERNRYVEELMNVDLVMNACEYNYAEIMEPLINIIAAGDDIYDVVIHAVSRMALLSVDGYLLNFRDGAHFDFTQDYWYDEMMRDLSFDSDTTAYLLAGDFFLDILRSTSALYVNKDMFNSVYESADELYDHVFNKTWTIDVFLSYIKDMYQDLNGNNQADDEDRYGYSTIGKYGSAFQWIHGGGLTFIDYDASKTPYIAIENERSVKMLERLNDIYYDASTHDYKVSLEANSNAFINGYVLFGGYQRVSSFEIFRDMEAEIGILPYPMLDDVQEDYTTAIGDISTVGGIPTTCQKLDTVSAVLEVLSRETKKTVMPAYYEEALKVKYARDDTSSQMLDIIRSSITGGFHTAYNNYFDGVLLDHTFSSPLRENKTTFASSYAKRAKKANAKLEELWSLFISAGE